MENKQKTITERVKTFEDAMKETGRPGVPEFLDVPDDLKEYFKAQYQMIVIIEALNEGEVFDWNNLDQEKRYPWFENSTEGLLLVRSYLNYSCPSVGDSSRLCFKSRELVEYAARQFTEIYKKIITG